ncbi:MAG: DNA replication and repair protein RecF, partial [Chromatiales bacterium]|nr:DNA replication and repair protein RecF [Chromatiales bacterium]
MSLKRLKATQLRNLQDIDLRPITPITVFQGENASGKTSLLEGIHILSCGKSFRTSQLSHVMRYGAERMVISGEIVSSEGSTHSIGIELDRRGASRVRMRAGGKPLHRTSELATQMPVIAIHQDSPQVFTEGPQYRRQFLDWGLFHVEPMFFPLWQRYRRALKQRTALLQQRAAGVEA